MSYDVSCDSSHISLQPPKNKRKKEIKSKKIDKNKIKIKYKSSSVS